MDDVIFRLFASLAQQGPGSPEDSMAVLQLIRSALPPAPQIADFGCGTGRSSLALAKALPDAGITAIDAVPVFVLKLQQTLEKTGLASNIRPLAGEMLASGIQPAGLDLVWSEGAAYAVGFETALRAWKPLLRTGGFAVVSECEWLSKQRSPDAVAFWRASYPQMGDCQSNTIIAENAGFQVMATHVLSDRGWQLYYDALGEALQGKDGQRAAPEFVRGVEAEIALWQACRGSYGYRFYVLRAC